MKLEERSRPNLSKNSNCFYFCHYCLKKTFLKLDNILISENIEKKEGIMSSMNLLKFEELYYLWH